MRQAVICYQQGKSQDLIFAEQAISNGTPFAAVDKIIKSNVRKRAGSRPKWDARLRAALVKSKGLPDQKYSYDAHHIVAKCDKRVMPAAEILMVLGIDIDDPCNGVFLPKDETSKAKGAMKGTYTHGNIHTKAYYANVNLKIVTAYENNADKDEVKRILIDIAEELQAGRYPVNRYRPGAEVYA
ncbi:hypothetical protein R50072_28370 [Simiduia litorea]